MIEDLVTFSISPIIGMIILIWGIYKERSRKRVCGKTKDLFVKSDNCYTLTGTVQNIEREYRIDSDGKTYYWYKPVIRFMDYDGSTWIRRVKNRVSNINTYEKGEIVSIIIEKKSDTDRDIYLIDCRDDYDKKGNLMLCGFGIMVMVMGTFIVIADKIGLID